MSPHAYLMVVTAGAAVGGLWLAVRLEQLAPHRGFAAAACFALAWFVPGLGQPLLSVTMSLLPLGLAILVGIFPVFVLTFMFIAFGLRYLLALAGPASR